MVSLKFVCSEVKFSLMTSSSWYLLIKIWTNFILKWPNSPDFQCSHFRFIFFLCRTHSSRSMSDPHWSLVTNAVRALSHRTWSSSGEDPYSITVLGVNIPLNLNWIQKPFINQKRCGDSSWIVHLCFEFCDLKSESETSFIRWHFRVRHYLEDLFHQAL